MKKYELFDKIYDFLFGIMCVSCGAAVMRGYLCEQCRAAFEREREVLCPVCGKRADEDDCVPKQLRMSYIKGVYSVGFYDKTERYTNILSRTVLKAKDEPDRRLTDFLSQLLADRLKITGADLSDYIFTYPPRAQSAVDETDVDLAGTLAETTAELYGLPFEQTLMRTDDDDDTPQKSLDAAARFAHMRFCFELYSNRRRHADVAGKNYIITDDVITTGATMLSAAEVLRAEGANDIIMLSVLKTAKQRKNQTGKY